MKTGGQVESHSLEMCKTCCRRTDNQTGTTPASPVSEPAAFEEDVAATNCLDLTGFCTSEEIKEKKKTKKTA